MEPLIIAIVLIYGIVVGSFLNVVIFRLPRHESIVTGPSHCMSCGHRLRWYELIPVLSFLIQGGRCRKCKTKLSPQYPLVESLNGVLWVVSWLRFGLHPDFFLGCALGSVLICISLIDAHTMEIPPSLNLSVGILGVVRCICYPQEILWNLLGFAAVSGILILIYIFTKGGGIGGGDIKLMAASGLLLGLKDVILAFVLACILGAVIHLFRMAFFHVGRKLAMGPYLSIGIWIAFFFGEGLIRWYLGLLV